MDRRELVLAAMSTANGGAYSPVQIQKLFFLIDNELDEYFGKRFFNFRPYDYGPFDAQVYNELDVLEAEGLVDISLSWAYRMYCLTPKGQTEGDELFSTLNVKQQEGLRKLSDFVRKLNFSQLVRAIYKAYPEMSQNSVFQDAS